jgi:hypothetical protein
MQGCELGTAFQSYMGQHRSVCSHFINQTSFLAPPNLKVLYKVLLLSLWDKKKWDIYDQP